MKQLEKIKHGGKKFEPVKWLSSFAQSLKKGDTFKKYQEVWIGLAIVLVVSLIIVLALTSTVDKVTPAVQNIVDNIVEDEVLRHPLTGEPVDKEERFLPQVFGVMVENSAEAWPLSGLDKAFLVIEAPVEGTIPRFIAFYSTDSEEATIGPVRSARSYYLDWNDEFDAVYTHVGGSPEALNLIANVYETIDLNQFWQSEYFYRQNSTRYAPHNVYTTTQNLISALEELDLGVPHYGVWQFKNDEPVEVGSKSLSVNFTEGTTYDVDWRYNLETNTYTRNQGTTEMHMENGATIEANNVAVIATDIRIIDNEGRRSVVTVGEGDALVAQDGQIILCRWRKEERTERLRFFDSEGEEIKMNAGSTWIEIVSSLSQATSHE